MQKTDFFRGERGGGGAATYTDPWYLDFSRTLIHIKENLITVTFHLVLLFQLFVGQTPVRLLQGWVSSILGMNPNCLYAGPGPHWCPSYHECTPLGFGKDEKIILILRNRMRMYLSADFLDNGLCPCVVCWGMRNFITIYLPSTPF